MAVLDQINNTGDIKRVPEEEYPLLAREIRRFLIKKVSENGGHLASNLGAVELTMALHLAFDPPKDKLIFDVGHQSYTHKLLTGRKEAFDTLRQYGGMSGFPNSEESPCDVFTTGHSSTSISTGLGLAMARDLSGEDYSVVSIIGDGSMTGGMAFEALNNASRLDSNFIIVLNDNDKSISDNVGGLSRAFQDLRTAPRYNRMKQNVKESLDRIPAVGSSMIRRIGQAKDAFKQMLLPNMYFENMGITYLGPINGHNVKAMVKAFQDARRVNRAVLVHVVTKKGKGYRFAEQNPELFHGIDPFDPKTGIPYKKKEKSYTDYITEGMLRLGEQDRRVCAITAAMACGTGLLDFQKRFPDRFFDVGIAEQHAVGFAGGLAKGGLKPYVCIYSSFLQRAYDQMIHDAALQHLPVTFLIDRSGLVGSDGVTHHGMLDAGYLQTIPDLTILSPRDGKELLDMLTFSLSFPGPLAIRYPRGAAPASLAEPHAPVVLGKSELLHRGHDLVLLALGHMVETAFEVKRILSEKGLDATLVNARFAKPFDKELLRELSADHSICMVLEEGNRSGSLGEHIADFIEEESLPLKLINLSPHDAFFTHGSTELLQKKIGLSAKQIAQKAFDALGDSAI